MRFRIRYADSAAEGSTREDWLSAPERGVQVVSARGTRIARPARESGYVFGLSPGRHFWTGADCYDPFGWGVKYGTLLPDEEYWRIWEEEFARR